MPIKLEGFEWTAKRATHNEAPGGHNEYVPSLTHLQTITLSLNSAYLLQCVETGQSVLIALDRRFL